MIITYNYHGDHGIIIVPWWKAIPARRPTNHSQSKLQAYTTRLRDHCLQSISSNRPPYSVLLIIMIHCEQMPQASQNDVTLFTALSTSALRPPQEESPILPQLMVDEEDGPPSLGWFRLIQQYQISSETVTGKTGKLTIGINWIQLVCQPDWACRHFFFSIYWLWGCLKPLTPVWMKVRST